MFRKKIFLEHRVTRDRTHDRNLALHMNENHGNMALHMTEHHDETLCYT